MYLQLTQDTVVVALGGKTAGGVQENPLQGKKWSLSCPGLLQLVPLPPRQAPADPPPRETPPLAGRSGSVSYGVLQCVSVGARGVPPPAGHAARLSWLHPGLGPGQGGSRSAATRPHSCIRRQGSTQLLSASFPLREGLGCSILQKVASHPMPFP